MKTGNCIAVIVGRFGGQSQMARALGTKQSTVWDWVAAGRVPSWRVPEIIKAARLLDPPVALLPNDFFDLSGCGGAPRAEEAVS